MVAIIIISTLLIVVGAMAALFGYSLFRLLLPLLGFFAGLTVGYTVIEAILGTNAFSLVVGVVTALIVGLVFAALSYFYFTLAVVLLAATVGAAVMAELAEVLQLPQDGFVTLLFTLSGALITGVFAYSFGLDKHLVMLVSAMLGVQLILVGVFLLFTNLSINELHETGVREAFRDIVSNHFVWLVLWFGASMWGYLIQLRTAQLMVLNNQYIFEEMK